MIGPSERQVSLFYVAFGAEASLIKDDLLEPIDDLLKDAQLIEAVRDALGRRCPKSSKTGRNGIAPDRLLRLVVLKHLKQWSFRDLEREVRASLVYRRFCRFDSDRIPHHANLSRSFAALSAPTQRLIHERVVALAQEHKVASGKKLRTDTTVVETNIHYPSDSTLLRDGVRVLSRVLERIAKQCVRNALIVRDRSRAVKHRVIEIHRGAKLLGERGRERRKVAYGKLLTLTRSVHRQARHTVSALKAGELRLKRQSAAVDRDIAELEHFLPLVEKVMAQTKARVFGGDNYHEGKVLSLFEPHSHAIRKGKVHKATEFGRLVRVDEVENGIISNVEVCDGNPADNTQWRPAIEQHKALFGHAPRMAVGDRGFYSQQNERDAKALGVKHVALPMRGKLSTTRRKHQKQRWFRNAHHFRAGVENRIATLKHRFGLLRAHYKDEHGFVRYVALGVVTNNLVSIARAQRKKDKEEKQSSAKRKNATRTRHR